MIGHRIALALTGALALGATPADAALQTSSWINYVDQNLPAVDQYGRGFGAIGVFAYDFDANGNLGPARPWVDATLATLRADTSAPGRLVLVAVTNDIESSPPVSFSGALIDEILSDPVKRAAHVRQLAAVAAKADGVDLDYENLLQSTHDNFTLFVQQLRAALPTGKRLIVTVQPKTSDAPGPRGQAVDWRGIAPFVDGIQVMLYYYADGVGAPGPPASLAQTRAVVGFAQGEIPASKLSLVLTEYGFDWPGNGAPGTLVSYQRATATARRYHAAVQRDPVDQTLRYDYADESGLTHQIWIDDAAALEAKISAIQGLGTSRVDMWSLGTGDPDFLSFLAAQNSSDAVRRSRERGGSPR